MKDYPRIQHTFTQDEAYRFGMVAVDAPCFRTVHGPHIAKTEYVTHPVIGNDEPLDKLIGYALHEARYRRGFTHVVEFMYIPGFINDAPRPYFGVRGCRVLAPVVEVGLPELAQAAA